MMYRLKNTVTIAVYNFLVIKIHCRMPILRKLFAYSLEVRFA